MVVAVPRSSQAAISSRRTGVGIAGDRRTSDEGLDRGGDPLDCVGLDRRALPAVSACRTRRPRRRWPVRLSRYGQLSPLAVCLREERPEVLDGFKRVAAVPDACRRIVSLQARLVEVDEPTAKAIILGLNGIGGRMKELEEAWIVQALVREDGLSQLQVAELLERHKSWVCRRLALLERLSEECREDLRSGAAVADDGPAVDAVARGQPGGGGGGRAAGASDGGRGPRGGGPAGGLQGPTAGGVHSGTSRDGRCGRPQIESLAGVGPAAECFGKPGVAAIGQPAWAGFRRMENWLRHRGRADLAPCDRSVLSPSFQRLSRDARTVAELAEDLLTEIDLP